MSFLSCHHPSTTHCQFLAHEAPVDPTIHATRLCTCGREHFPWLPPSVQAPDATPAGGKNPKAPSLSGILPIPTLGHGVPENNVRRNLCLHLALAVYNSLFHVLSPAPLPVHLPMILGDARALQMLSEESPTPCSQCTGSPARPMVHPPHRQERTCILAVAQPTDPTRDVLPVSVGTRPHPNPADAGGSCSVGMVR